MQTGVERQQRLAQIAVLPQQAAIARADRTINQVRDRPNQRFREPHIDPGGIQQRVVRQQDAGGSVDVNAGIAAKGDQVVPHRAVSRLIAGPAEVAVDAGTAAAPAKRQPDAGSQRGTRTVAQVPLAQDHVAQEPGIAGRGLGITAVRDPVAVSLDEIGDQGVGNGPAAGRVEIDRHHRIAGPAGPAVQQGRKFDPAAIGEASLLAVDLDLRVEVLQHEVAQQGPLSAADDVKGVLAGGVVGTDAADCQILEVPVGGGQLEGFGHAGLDHGLAGMGGAQGDRRRWRAGLINCQVCAVDTIGSRLQFQHVAGLRIA